MKITVLADQIRAGDRLSGGMVVANCVSHGRPSFMKVMLQDDQHREIATLPNDWPVEVERPDPTLTVTVELTLEELRYAAHAVGAASGFRKFQNAALAALVRAEAQQ